MNSSPCHTNSNDYSIFQFTNCHLKAGTDPRHWGVMGYVYNSIGSAGPVEMPRLNSLRRRCGDFDLDYLRTQVWVNGFQSHSSRLLFCPNPNRASAADQ
jgi:hypothetical protein